MINRNIYICGAINGVAPEVLLFYEYLAEALTKKDYNPYIPHQNTTDVFDFSDPDVDVLVFRKDMEAFNTSDMVLAYLGERSLGVGAELDKAITREKHILAYWEHDRIASRFVTGMIKEESTTYKLFTIDPIWDYKSIAKIVSTVEKYDKG